MSPPLAEMSSNIQESDSAGRKRSHDEFADKARNSDDTAQPSGSEREEHLPETARLSALTIHPEHRPDSTPQGSPALTDSTTAHNSSSPPTPGKTQNTADDTASKNTTATTSTSAPSQPPSKKKRLTQAERDARDKEAAEKKKKAEEEKAAKAREREEREKEAAEKKKKAEEEKQARAREREEKRKKKEEEDKLKTQEREEKKRKKEEEQRAIQEAKDKKARQQPKLMNFFGAQASPKKPSAAQASPQKAAATAATSDASEKPADYVYRRRFQPFFVKENTQWAEPRASDETKSARLDEYVSAAAAGNDETLPERLDAASLLPLPVDDKGRCCHRGKLHRPVKNIMEQAYRELQTSQGTEGAGKAMDAARSRLARIPVKVIAFSQDVRPPYYGTVTLRPYALGRDHMRRLARRPTGRSMPLEYDYDSEAEWQEEEGEDLDADDDEEEIDDEDDMDGFLDDSEDVGPARRAFVNTMEPESTGICFEDGARRTENERVRAHKMEFILGEYNEQASEARTAPGRAAGGKTNAQQSTANRRHRARRTDRPVVEYILGARGEQGSSHGATTGTINNHDGHTGSTGQRVCGPGRRQRVDGGGRDAGGQAGQAGAAQRGQAGDCG